MSDLGIFNPDLYAKGDPWKSGLPLELFAELRDERPCYWQSLEDEPMFIDGVWVMTRYADIVAIIRDTERFSNKAGTSVRRFDPTVAECGGKPTMMSMDGARHRNNRTVTNRMFSLRAINTLEDRFRAIATRLVERALDMGRIDFVTDVARYMPLEAVSDLLGIPPEDREQVLAWTNMITVPLDPHFTPTRRDFQEALDGLWRYGLELAERRLEDPDGGVMTAISEGPGRRPAQRRRGLRLYAAARSRRQRDDTQRNRFRPARAVAEAGPDGAAARGNGTLPESAIEEILRWSAPTIHTVRLALQDLEVLRSDDSCGRPVALVLGSGNFDPSKFEAPEAFNVMRSPNEHIAFGTAAHTCLGLHVARLELKVMFEQLLRRCTSIELDGDVEFVRDNLIHGVRKMPLALS